MKPSHSGVSALVGSRTQVLLVLGLALLASARDRHPAELASVDVGRPQLVNRNSAGEVSSHSAAFGDLDRSGRYVVFYQQRAEPAPSGRRLRGRLPAGPPDGPDDHAGPQPARQAQPDGLSGGSLSPNGRFLAFCSFDPNIVKPDSFTYDEATCRTSRTPTSFVRDLRTGATRRLSTAWNGKEADDHSCGVQVADNGDAIFTSFASDLVRHDPNGSAEDTFLYDWSRGTCTASAS